MAVAYEVEAELLWKSNVPEVLQQMMRGFSEVNRMVNDLRDSLGELASGGRGMAALNRQMERLKASGGALDALRDMGRATGALAVAQRDLAESSERSARAWRDMAEASRKVRAPAGGSGGSRGHGGGHVSAMDAAMGAQMAGDFGIGLAERSLNAYGDVQMKQFAAQSDKALTDIVMVKANALIKTLQAQYPALTQSEGLTLFRNTMGIFGSAGESLKALPGAVRLQMLYQLLPQGKGGTGGDEVQAAEKAGDIMQAFVNPQGGLDLNLYNKFMDFQARSYQAGGGLVDAKNWLAFARTSRTAGIGLSDRAMEEAQALLEISPGRTGTALQSAFQVFGATTRHMTKGNRAAWQHAGLLGRNGNIIDQQLYQSDPFEWVWKDMLPALKKHGIATRDQILRWLTENGQRGTVAGVLADIAIGQTPITRTADKMERQDPNLVDKLQGGVMGQMAALHAAETNLFVAMGKFLQGPGIELMNNLAKGLNKLADEMNAHPDLSKNVLLFGGGLALVSKVMGDAGMAYLFVGSPLIAGVQALSGALPGMAAGVKALLAAAGKSAPSAPSAANPWGTVESIGATALRWGGKIASTVGLGFLGWEAGKSVATSPEWQAFGDHIEKAVRDGLAKRSDGVMHATINVNVDGKKVQTTRTIAPVQSGTTGHDGSMSLYPAGLPSGGG